MFAIENIRTPLASTLLALLLISAGCVTTVDPGEMESYSENPTEDRVTSTHTSSPTTTSSAELSSYADEQGTDNAGLSSTEKERARGVIANFSERLPEGEEQRREQVLSVAEDLCRYDRNYTNRVNISQIEQGGTESQQTARRLAYASEILNEQFTDDVPVRDFALLRNGVDDATRYVPILGSYNRLVNNACAAKEDRSDEAIRRFQISAMMFGVDTVLISTGGLYRPAFAGTRYIMNSASKVGLYRLRYVCGNRCWALAWSETHWIVRGEMMDSIHSVAQLTAESNLEITDQQLSQVAERQGIDPSRVSEELVNRGEELVSNVSNQGNTTSNLSQEASDYVEEISENPENVDEAAEDAASSLFGEDEEEQSEESPC